VLGFLDDLVLVPLGIWVLIRMIPLQVMAEARVQASDPSTRLPVNWYAGVVVVLLWVLFVMWVASLVYHYS
jgi:hypothetical protein